MSLLRSSLRATFKPAMLLRHVREALSSWPGKTGAALARARSLSSRGTGGRRRQHDVQRREALRFEALEPRVLLSADLAYTIDVPIAIEVRCDAGVVKIVDQTGVSHGSMALDQIASVRIVGSHFDDQVTVDAGSFAAANVPVFFNDLGDGDQDSLSVKGAGLQWTLDPVKQGGWPAARASSRSRTWRNLSGPMDRRTTSPSCQGPPSPPSPVAKGTCRTFFATRARRRSNSPTCGSTACTSATSNEPTCRHRR
jgi:hypothetical protein